MALKIELIAPGSGPDFLISATRDMPDVTVRLTGPELAPRATTAGSGASATALATYDWKATLVFSCIDAPHGPTRVVSHPEMRGRTTTADWKVPFTTIRGGNLSVSVTAKVGNQTLEATLSDLGGKPLRVLGSNPSKLQLHQAISSKALRLIVQNESSCRQFRDGLPLFSQDNLGGVGLLQITSPQPADDEIWDWQANVRAAISLFSGKLAIAKAFPGQVRSSTKFRALVASYNAARAKMAKGVLDIRLPDFTPDQVEIDAIRGYNGYAGTDFFLGPRHLHEFRVPLKDATGATPSLVVREDQDKLSEPSSGNGSPTAYVLRPSMAMSTM